MIHPNDWPELNDLASQWATSPTVIRFKESITSPVKSTAELAWTDGVGQLKTMLSGEMRKPLKLAQWFPMLLGATGANVPTEFLENATKAYAASAQTLAWIRAQLPGYPSIKAPQLSRGTHRTTNEFAWGIPWRQEEFALGLQSAPYSVRIPQVLGVRDPTAFAGAVFALQLQLRETEAWKQYAINWQELVDDDKNQLTESRSRIAKRLSPTELDAFEPNLSLPRVAYRQRVVSEEIGMLSGPAHAFAEAFEKVDRLIEFACIDALSYVVFFGQPGLVTLTEGLEFCPGPPSATVRFAAHGFYQTGELVQIDDPVFCGLALISGVQYTQSEKADLRITATAELID